MEASVPSTALRFGICSWAQSGYMSKSPWPGKLGMHRHLCTMPGPSSGVLQVHSKTTRNKHLMTVTYLAVNLGSQSSVCRSRHLQTHLPAGESEAWKGWGTSSVTVRNLTRSLRVLRADHTIPLGIRATSPKQATCPLMRHKAYNTVFATDPMCAL